jgi:hypothetical protein
MLVFMTVASLSPAGAEEGASLPGESVPAFSLFDVLPFPAAGNLSLADRPQTPTLAGERRSAAARGLEPVGARRFAPIDGYRLYNETVFAGGILDETLFAGIRQSLGVGFDAGGIIGFGRLDGTVEYGIPTASGSGEGASGFGAAGGFAGNSPVPWVIACRAVLGGTGDERYATLALEAGDTIAEVESLGALSAAGQIGTDLGGGGASSSDAEVFARGQLELEGRRYSGALARGIAAWAAGEVRLDAVEGGVDADFRAGAQAATAFGAFAGLSGALSFLAATEPQGTWTDEPRGLSAEERPIESSLGAALSLEGAVLLARGRLFLDPGLGVEFFIKPFVDAALIRPVDGELFSANSLFLTAGGEIAMTLDRDRRQCLGARASLDCTGFVRGEESFPSPNAATIEFSFAFAF